MRRSNTRHFLVFLLSCLAVFGFATATASAAPTVLPGDNGNDVYVDEIEGNFVRNSFDVGWQVGNPDYEFKACNWHVTGPGIDQRYYVKRDASFLNYGTCAFTLPSDVPAGVTVNADVQVLFTDASNPDGAVVNRTGTYTTSGPVPPGTITSIQPSGHSLIDVNTALDTDYAVQKCSIYFYSEDSDYWAHVDSPDVLFVGQRDCVNVPQPSNLPTGETIHVFADVQIVKLVPGTDQTVNFTERNLYSYATIPPVSANQAPTVANVRLDGITVRADAADSDGWLDRCSYVIESNDGGTYSDTVFSTEKGDPSETRNLYGNQTRYFSADCNEPILEDQPSGEYKITFTAYDEDGASTTETAIVNYTRTAPVVTNVSLIGSTLIADVETAFGNNRTCRFILNPGTPDEQVITGQRDNFMEICKADAPVDINDIVDVRASATNRTGETGVSADTPIVFTARPATGSAYRDYDIYYDDDPDNDNDLVYSYSVSPAPAACSMGFYYGFEDSGGVSRVGDAVLVDENGDPINNGARVAAVQPGFRNANVSYVVIAGTYNATLGACQVTVPENDLRPASAPSSYGFTPYLMVPIAQLAGAPLSPPTVNDITLVNKTLSAHADDTDGSIVSCGFRIVQTSSGFDQTVNGVYDLAAERCRVQLPAATPHGSLDITATATDNDNLTGSDTGQVLYPNNPPTVNDITLIGENLSGHADDTDGQIVKCEFRIVQTSSGFDQTVIGTYDTPAERCRVQLPTGTPYGDLEVTLTATDDDDATGSDTGTVDHLSPPTVNDITLVGENLSSHADDIDGVIVKCEFRIRQSSSNFDQMVIGTYDAPAERCRVQLPTGTPFGDLAITVTATDDDDLTGTDNAIVDHQSPPTVNDITLIGRSLSGHADDIDGTIVKCEFRIVQTSSNFDQTVLGTYDTPAERCRVQLPTGTPFGNLDVTLTATDDDGLTGSDTATVDHTSGPIVNDIKLINKELSGHAEDEDGTIVKCEFRIEQASSGYDTSVIGTYDAAAERCRVALPNDAPFGDLKITLTATDDDGLTGSDVGTVDNQSPPTVNDIKLVGESLSGHAKDIDGTIVKCEFRIQQASSGFDQTVIGTYDTPAERCRVQLPAGTPYGDLQVRLTATDDDGLTGTDTAVVDHLSPPTVNDIKLIDKELSSHADDIDGYIVVCGFRIRQTSSGFDQTVTGAYDAAAKRCRVQLPVGTPFGDLDVTASATDDDNLTGTDRATVDNQSPPTVNDIKLVDGEISSHADDIDGVIVKCTFRIVNGSFDRTVDGTWDSAAKRCRVRVPADTPHGKLDVTVTATDDDGLTGTDRSTVDYPNREPIVTNVRVGDDLVGNVRDEDGTIVKCEFVLDATGYHRVVPGVYNDALQECRAPKPTDFPTDRPVKVVLIATDNDGATAQDLTNTPVANQCVSDRLRIINLRPAESRYTLIQGIARKDQAGKTVRIQALYRNKGKTTVKTGKVKSDGTWSIKAPLPPKSIRNSNKAMYRAQLDGVKTKWLKLTRYLTVTKMTAGTQEVKVSGYVGKAYPGQKVDVVASTACGTSIKVSSAMRVDKKGRFEGAIKVKSNDPHVVVRLRTRAKNKVKSFYTYSIAQPLTLKTQP